jgi:hypothetical protein
MYGVLHLRLLVVMYVSFIDDYNKFTWLYLLKRKSDVLSFLIFFSKVSLSRIFIEKFLLYNLIGEEIIWNLTLFFKLKESHIMSHVHMLISRMDLQSVNIAK